MEVAELWRYPVKSLGGEQMDEAEVTPSGLVGDRRYAIFDATTGLGMTARRAPEMLFARARWRDDGAVQITLPDGRVSRGDDDLSDWLGRPVMLRAANQVRVRMYEATSDPDEDESTWSVFSGASGAFHDSGRAKVTLVSRGTLGEWDRRRFRANVVLTGDGEDDLVDRAARMGDVELRVTKRIDRCVMVTRPQPDGVSLDRDVLRAIHRERGGCLAVGALVTQPGIVRLGDPVT
ncbi:MAG TPA: MOSC N-terminal beta barrel domain-containing protein [Actinomycetales bacterium]|nr:MOSC N-terminal beta barrel domain-containing protein [Actinomycetales bacterium]